MLTFAPILASWNIVKGDVYNSILKQDSHTLFLDVFANTVRAVVSSPLARHCSKGNMYFVSMNDCGKTVAVSPCCPKYAKDGECNERSVDIGSIDFLTTCSLALAESLGPFSFSSLSRRKSDIYILRFGSAPFSISRLQSEILHCQHAIQRGVN